MSKRKYDHAFVVDRETWIRGGHDKHSMLCRGDDGKQCCLGFFLRSCGVSKTAISDRSTPSDVGKMPKKAAFLLEDSQSGDSVAAYSMMEVNDDNAADAAIEEKLKKLFAENKVRITFKGKRRPTNKEM